MPTAAAELYRDTPKYVGNEMPVDEVMAWAMEQPGFVGIWIDRENNGWVSVSFSEGAAERQAELTAMFPEEGVVAVPVDWTEASLRELEVEISDQLAGVVPLLGTSVQVERGVVDIYIDVLTAENLAVIGSLIDTSRICVEGLEPENVVPPGPQPVSGDGWRLLVDAKGIGFPYMTGIAWDEESLTQLISTIIGGEGLDADFEVDFQEEIVVWFGAVYSGSCPTIRLDDLVVDGNVLHAVIVDVDNALVCTADANPHTYLVALERAVLPGPPFYVQLRRDGAGGDRLLVTTDLRPPGSTATSAQVGPDPNPPGPEPERSGTVIEPGYPSQYEIDLGCGLEWLGEINSYHWVASTPVPEHWLEATSGMAAVVVEVTLHEGPDPFVEVAFEGETVIYKVGEPRTCG